MSDRDLAAFRDAALHALAEATEQANGAPTPTTHVPAFRVSVTDTTGAGDAFHGTFALMLTEGRAAAECARLAAAAAAMKCTRLGSRAGLPLRAELEAFARSRG